ncbi:MAG: bifunctional phosphoribosyl-AMP cyclohydrolase/phosphoribosyl-ATP diphosphatase HisIE [Clostridia bacterium]|nr:bifunctional phosphoribosyl-AMP cyclohydrolase/phosphoribosyl-ATP diphosphatase HisIE [Clostridia bacterium]
MNTTELNFDAQGLIPCIVQDADSGRVLMLAYMNEQSITVSLAERRTCFWSRSRGELWRKGQSSGHVQHLLELVADCDGDTLLARVRKDGPACHTGAESCFFQPLWDGKQDAPDENKPARDFSLARLYELLSARNRLRPEGSYTSYLFNEGREKILKKIGEESAEVLIAAMKDSRAETIYEIADLCYHTLALMVEMGIAPADILDELASRHIIDKKTKQETRK